jgi:ElaB/YqjD/DUF883 family membrane-anchored ribosome-binding protein
MDNMRKMTETLAKDGDQFVERVNEVADSTRKNGHKTWKELSAQGKEAWDGAQKSTQEAWEDAHILVKKHPGKAMSLALTLGAIIGAAFIALRNNE